ncbi:MAG: 2-C-methyl-D-erythritol 2,4-cyclodiphosphate synthase [bacterium]|nr:2-C-methyl-D-erythritol 2,4-cyclodiphosphate synthase [bacterium]
MRIGQGVDVHRLVEGRDLVLGGVKIPYHMGLLGHSDADVIVHSIIDSILGASGSGDIGHLFPDNDAKWKNANSIDLLKRAYSIVKEKGWQIVNIDVSLLLEKPKIAPFINQMKKNISEVLEISQESCAIKATTSEGLGFVGREEGAISTAVSLLRHI